MSMCGSCKLYCTEDANIPESLRCEGSQGREDCVGHLQDYIDELETELTKKVLELNELIWQWQEVVPGTIVSCYDGDHDWYISQISHQKYEIGYLTKGQIDIDQSGKQVAMAYFLPSAKMWVYQNFTRFKKGENT